jgi:hypothetical protein
MPAHVPSCRTCGYTREGLSPLAYCPECGDDPPTEAELREKPHASRTTFAALVAVYVLACSVPGTAAMVPSEYGFMVFLGAAALWWLAWYTMMMWVTKQDGTQEHRTFSSITIACFFGACPLGCLSWSVIASVLSLFR